MLSRKIIFLIVLVLGLIVLGVLFIRIYKIEKIGKVDFDYIKGGSVLYEVFITDDGEKYSLSWQGHTNINDVANLRSISTKLSYLPPFGDLKVKLKGYKGFWQVNLSKNGSLSNFVMSDFQILNSIDELSYKNVYICLENSDLKAFYSYSSNEQRSGSMGPTSFELEFPENEKERLINLIKKLINIRENCKNTPDACDRDPKVCNLAKVDSRYSRCSNWYLECREGTSSALRLNATGKGYFVKNSIIPHFEIERYDINDLGGAYSDLIKSFRDQSN